MRKFTKLLHLIVNRIYDLSVKLSRTHVFLYPKPQFTVWCSL
jgi:hypothetical protein